MRTGSVRYKTLSPGCQVRIAPLAEGSPQARLLGFQQKRRKPSAGLIVDSDDPFEVGSQVVLDLKFPDQPFTYRSVGTVSWAIPRDDGLGHKLGVLVYGMDKLDQDGISVSMAPASPLVTAPPASPVEPPAQAPTGKPDFEPASKPRDSQTVPLASVVSPDPAPPREEPKPPAESPSHRTEHRRGFREDEDDQRRSDENTGSFSAELVSLCAVDLKIAGWLGATASTAPVHPAQTPARSLHELRESLPRHMLEQPEAPTRGARPAPSQESLSPSPMAPFPPAQSTAPPPPTWRSAESKAPKSRNKNAVLVDPGAVKAAPAVSVTPSKRRPSRPARGKSEIPVVELDIDLEVDLELDAEETMMQAFEQIHELYGCPDVQSAAQFALDLACELVRCRGGICGLVAQDRYEIEVLCACGEIDAHRVPARLPMSSSLLGHAVRTGNNIYVSNPAQDPMFDAEHDGLMPELENAVSVPVQREGYSMGALELVGSPRLSGFVAAEVNAVSYIAMALAEFLEAQQNRDDDTPS